mgnify:FL=1
MKHLLFISLILLCSCHSDSSRKGQKDETDSIRLQKELGALHRYVDSINSDYPVLSDDNLYMLFVF